MSIAENRIAGRTRRSARNSRLSGPAMFISFLLHAGEIVGLGELDGQEQRDLLLALFGILRTSRHH